MFFNFIKFIRIILAVIFFSTLFGLLLTVGGDKSLLYGFTLQGKVVEQMQPLSRELSGSISGQKEDSPVIGNKRIFRRPAAQKGKNIRTQVKDMAKIAKDLNLVGIMHDGGPKAVIEDKKTSKTYFLRVSDRISDMEIVDIKEDEVILQMGEEQYSLVL